MKQTLFIAIAAIGLSAPSAEAQHFRLFPSGDSWRPRYEPGPYDLRKERPDRYAPRPEYRSGYRPDYRSGYRPGYRPDYRVDPRYDSAAFARPREVFRYPDGHFQDHGNGAWMAHRFAGPPIPFVEVNRTPDYVELYDSNRDLYVRLHDNMLYQLDRHNGGWFANGHGHWE